MGLRRAIVAAFLTVLSILSSASGQSCVNSEDSDSCIWEITTNSKKYSFDLATPTKGHPHGIRSEDGYCSTSHCSVQAKQDIIIQES